MGVPPFHAMFSDDGSEDGFDDNDDDSRAPPHPHPHDSRTRIMPDHATRPCLRIRRLGVRIPSGADFGRAPQNWALTTTTKGSEPHSFPPPVPWLSPVLVPTPPAGRSGLPPLAADR